MRRVVSVIALVALPFIGRAQGCDSLRRQDSITLERYLDTITSLTAELNGTKHSFLVYKDHTEDFVFSYGKIRNQRTIFMSTTVGGLVAVGVILLLRR